MIDIQLILIAAIVAYGYHVYMEVTDDEPGVRPFTRAAITRAAIGGVAGLLVSLVIGYF